MNPWQEAKKRPVMSGVTLVGAAGAIMLFMGVLPGMELIVSIKKAPVVAEAALEKAKEVEGWFKDYVEREEERRNHELELSEQEAKHQQQMLDLQRQQQQQWQVPNQSSQPQRPPPQMQTIPNLPYPQPQWEWRQDEQGNWFCTDGRESWWPDEQTGDCE